MTARRWPIRACGPISRSPEGAALWQGSGGVPQSTYFSPPFLLGRGRGGWCAPPSRRVPSQAGVQRAPPYGRGLGVSPRAPNFLPPSRKEGGEGDGTHAHHSVRPHKRNPEGVAARVRGCPQAPASGESRGEHPLWQEVWRMCLHTLLFLISPFLEGRGTGGWCSRPSRRAVPTSGGPEGAALWQGSGGVPQSTEISAPFLKGRGRGRWYARPSQRTTPQAGVQRAPPYGGGLGVSPRVPNFLPPSF